MHIAGIMSSGGSVFVSNPKIALAAVPGGEDAAWSMILG